MRAMMRKMGQNKLSQATRPALRQVVLPFFRAVYRSLIRPVWRFIYWCVAKFFAELSFLARVVAVLAPDFFLLYQGDVLAPTSVSPEFQALRVLMAITMSFFFAIYFFWDAVVVAGHIPKKYAHLSGDEWDRAKAAMDDADPSMMGTTAWMKERARKIKAGELPGAGPR